MLIGVNVGHSAYRRDELNQWAKAAEEFGYHSLWIAETYGADALVSLAYVAQLTSRIQLGTAILPLAARSPAATAMGAMTVDMLSNGRFSLGLGVSGPQVVEGWHGRAFRRPVQQMREYVDIVRQVIARDSPVCMDGELYSLPFRGTGATGTGKALKTIMHPVRNSIDIFVAGMGPRNVALAGEVADGWLPLFYCPSHQEILDAPLLEGMSRRRSATAPLKVVTVPVEVGDDVAACRDALRSYYALYFGGMGSRQQNFHGDVLRRIGYGDVAESIQERFLAGDRAAAAAAVPDELIDELALVGSVGRIRERVAYWASLGTDQLLLRARSPSVLEALETLMRV